MITPSSARLAAAGFPDPTLLHARAALGAQRAALAHSLVRLERVRAQVPLARGDDTWRGAAQLAYRSSVHDLGRRVDELIECVREATRSTSRALETMDARVG